MKKTTLIKRITLVFLSVVMVVCCIPFSASAASANVKTIYEFCIKELKLNNAGACGVLANIEAESNFNPNLYGDGGDSYVPGEILQPPDDLWIRSRAEHFGEDVRVEDNHSKSAARARSARSGVVNSSKPPRPCATFMRARPTLGRRTARVRMSRASASMDLPCSLASAARSAFTDSSSPRTIIDVIVATSLS